VDGSEFEANVSVSPAVDDFLLGSNWLETNGATWDFATGTLHFGDRVIHAYRRTLGRVCRQITVLESCVVPARHEANISVEMAELNIPHPADNWVIETKQLSSRVMTARMLVDPKQERLVARICNYSDEPYSLEAGSCLTRAEPVECLPGPGEEISNRACNGNCNYRIQPMSVLSGDSAPPGLSPITGRDLAAALNVATGNANVTATGAETATTPVTKPTTAMGSTPSTDNPMPDDPYGHIKCLLDGLPDDLTAEQRAYATAFIQSRANVFSYSEYDIGRTKIIPHCIDTGNNTPHFEQLRRHLTTQLPMIDEHVEHMLAHGVIEPAASPWCFNVVMVRKQDGSMRFCVDYRKVNELIKKDKFPLLKIDTCECRPPITSLPRVSFLNHPYKSCCLNRVIKQSLQLPMTRPSTKQSSLRRCSQSAKLGTTNPPRQEKADVSTVPYCHGIYTSVSGITRANHVAQ